MNSKSDSNKSKSFTSEYSQTQENPYQTRQINSRQESFNDFYIHENNKPIFTKKNIIIVSSVAVLLLIIFSLSFMNSDKKNDLAEIVNNGTVVESNLNNKEVEEDIEFVTFQDKSFETLIKEALGKGSDDELMSKELDTITEIHIKKDSNINSLIDLKLIRNVNKIIIEKRIKDIHLIKEGIEPKEIILSDCNFNDLEIFKNITNIKKFHGSVKFSNLAINTGEFVFNNEDVFAGEFSEGIIKNKGTYTYKNGGILKGLYNDIDFSGNAKLYYGEDALLFSGFFDGKYTTKGNPGDNFFNAELKGEFYNKEKNRIFLGEYIGRNTIKDGYFEGEIIGKYYNKNNLLIDGSMLGSLSTDYESNSNYHLDGKVIRNNEIKLNGVFEIIARDGIEVHCQGKGYCKLPDEMDLNGLILEGELVYDLDTKTYTIDGEAYRIINGEKVYEKNNNNNWPTPSSKR